MSLQKKAKIRVRILTVLGFFLFATLGGLFGRNMAFLTLGIILDSGL